MIETVNRENWKVKYRELLDELEVKQRNWQKLDDELRTAASRLAIAAMGSDRLVDRWLEEIRNSIRSRTGGPELQRQLEGLTGAVVAHEKRRAMTASIDLPGFVADLQLPQALRHRFITELETDTGSFQAQSLTALASELNQLLTIQSTDAADAAPDQASVVRSVLARLADHIRDVPALSEVIDDFEQGLSNNSGNVNWDEPLSSLVTAITEIIETMKREKSALEEFLEQVTKQLEQIEKWTVWQDTQSKERLKDTDDFGSTVEQQVDELHADINASTELDDLKTRVQSRLDTIAGQLTEFRQRDEKRRDDAHTRNAALKEEINKLKVRTSQLAHRCTEQESQLAIDTLTGVYTRHAYETRLQEEFQRWQRHRHPLVFTIWDIDHFKSVNDNFGHQAGDRLLKVIAGMLSNQTRTEDFVARIGGEEFVALFPSTPLDAAVTFSNRLRDNIAATVFRHQGTALQVSVSCGLTEFRDGDTPADVYERADQALYKAKNAGRNRCVSL